MTMDMNCDVFHDRLMAYLEDDTDAATRAAVERHAVTCVECGAVLADLRKLRMDAANLPELAPSRDLWAGVAERIHTPVVPIGAGTRAVTARRSFRRVWQVGLLAASLVGAASLGYLAGQRPEGASPTGIASAPSAPDVPDTLAPAVVDAPVSRELPATVASAPRRDAPDAAGRAPVVAAAPAGTAASPATTPGAYNSRLVVATLTADYDREIARLTTLIETRRNQMDPATVAIIERNLQIIDAAITESKTAILRDPASRFLIESLNQSLRMKVELMRTAAMLPSRT